ncbi:TonB-dependent receptor [Mucilaginibacter sp.]|uniref:SusC/RagA family TonB-linked outer membrane protein n=1 Tax=Mucilaginibacter sp. TaxID=1882438 RepID=UPI00261C58FB|nr:TonB-dependent receptor [Mucilaginibacter sp.]MDB4924212.1 TonB-dependent receptor [Mucilaginibacter sp.]
MNKKQLLLKLLFCPLFLLLSVAAFAQQTLVAGKITDEKGEPIPGATIIVKGSPNGTNTDLNGNYAIKATGKSVLVFSSVGFVKQEVAVNDRTIINITLANDEKLLNEIVVIGYGTQRRRDITGSVASVRGSDFKDQPITNPILALQGRVAGVNVIQSSGAPDATPSIVIRGLASFHQPNPLYIVDGVRVPDVNSVNVQDIATIDVLKDAASAAIYGSAAAGGVLVITTKKGTGTQPTINLSARYGITKPKLVSLLDKNGFIQLQNIVNPKFFAGATKLDTLANTDWVHTMYRDAVEQNYNLSISGSTPVVNYLFSGFYNGQKGVYLKNYSNIGGARINTDYKLGKFITIGEQLGISQRQTSPLIGNEANLHNAPFRTQPIIPIYNKDGSYGTVPAGYNGLAFQGPNPYGAVQSATASNAKNNLQANVYADIKLPLHLDFRTTIGYSYYYEAQDYFQDAYKFGSVSLPNNTLFKYDVQSSQLLTNYVLSYNQSFGKHNISALAGYEQIVNKNNSLYGSESSIGINGYSFVQTSSSSLALSGTNDPNGLIKSQFGRINYNYANKYYLSGSIRQDANYNVFGPNKQKGVFPAASAGWNLGEEEFFKRAVPALNVLKFRGSYGSLGNSNIPAYSYASTYTQNNTSTGISGGAQGFAPGQPFQIANSTTKLPNANVHWETVTETNIGLDGEALSGNLYFSAEWYNKNTKDMLYALQLPTSTGFTTPYITNIGKVNNTGFDFMVGYRNKAGDLGYDISVTAGFNKNKVVSLAGAATDAVYDGYNYYSNGDAAFQKMANQTLTISKAGLPLGSFYGYKVLGIFTTDAEAAGQKVNGNVAHAGDLHYEDIDGNGTINSNDRQVIGNPNPKLVYGINMHFNYKGFDLALLFNGVAGAQLFNGVKAYEQSLFQDGNTTSQVFNDSFLGNNGLTKQPRLGIAQSGGFTMDPNQNYSSVNSYFVESGNYLKLKNVQLGYTFKNSLLQKVAIKSARIFVMTNNVFTITKYSGLDPELGSAFTPSGYGTVTTQGIDAVTNYPQTKIYTAGLDLTF